MTGQLHHRRGHDLLLWLRYVEDLAVAWKELRDKLDTPGTRRLDRDLWKLSLIRWHEWRPLALLWYQKYIRRRDETGWIPKNDFDVARRRFAELHGRCLAITLAGFSPADRAKIFGRAIQQLNRGADPLTQALTFDDGQRSKMVRTLMAPMLDPELRRTLVRWIEASLWTEDEHLPSYIGAATVEHVLPQNPPEGSPWLELFPDPEELYRATHSLGNLVPLDWDRQKAAGNSPFPHKRSVYDALPRFKTLEAVQLVPEWNRVSIRARQKQLVREILEKTAPLAPPRRSSAQRHSAT